MSAILKKKINSLQSKIAVIGLGYVGLPIAYSFAQKGFEVLGLDMDHDRVAQVNNCESYILDIKNADLKKVVKKGFLRASVDFKRLALMDVVIICVPTPLKRRYTPDVSFILNAVKTICANLGENTLVVLESTTYPGTTEELIKPVFDKAGFTIDKDYYLAFSPERIDPGNKEYDVVDIPKIVGGVTDKSSRLTELLYKKIIKDVHIVATARAAEMTKLLENSFRIINIGWINEVAQMCHKMDIDVWEVIEAAETKPFGFMPFYPGLGVGGHCIPDDPLYLYWRAKHSGFSSRFIKLSADINHMMPAYAVDRILGLVKNTRKPKILIVGVTYKKDVHDLRKSPALSLIESLEAKKVKVDYYDPIIPYLKIGTIDLVSIDLSAKKIKEYDCVVIAVDHTKTDYKLIQKNAQVVFDTKNVFGKTRSKNVVKL